MCFKSSSFSSEAINSKEEVKNILLVLRDNIFDFNKEKIAFTSALGFFLLVKIISSFSKSHWARLEDLMTDQSAISLSILKINLYRNTTQLGLL